MTGDRRTLEDALIARGAEASGEFACPHCHRSFPAFALVDVSDISRIPDDVACGDCLISAKREDIAKAEAAAPVSTGWDGPIGQTLRADRNRMLDLWAWTIRADSPLTADCRAAWAEWFIAMNQMTVSGIEPESWHFPNTPELEYMAPDEAAARLRSLAAI